MQDPAYNALSSPRFAELAEQLLAFTWQVLQDPTLKDHPLPQFFFFFFESNGMYFNIDLKGDLNRSPYFMYTCRLPNFTSEP